MCVLNTIYFGDNFLHCREFYDASIRAYVSFVRFYRKHELQLIFRLKGQYCDFPCIIIS